jgi:hypothetical protein
VTIEVTNLVRGNIEARPGSRPGEIDFEKALRRTFNPRPSPPPAESGLPVIPFDVAPSIRV